MLEFTLYLFVCIFIGSLAIVSLAVIGVPMLLFVTGVTLGLYLSFGWYLSRPNAKEKLRVLLVDDSPSTLALINSILKYKNCQIKIVDCGLKGIEELSREKYDLLILDFFMAGLNGSETLMLADHAINQQITTKKSSFQIPVIEYTSCKEDAIRPETMNHFTMVGKLNKNMPPSILKPLINQILSEIKVCSS